MKLRTADLEIQLYRAPFFGKTHNLTLDLFLPFLVISKIICDFFGIVLASISQ
jgi:hypothetical protein